MANTPTIHQRAASSSVAKKALMAITGLLLIAFLLMHMFGNTKLFLGRAAFNDYSEALRDFLHPILPHMFFLWCFRIFMVAAILIHIYCAVSVWKQANGGKYQRSKSLGRYTPFLMRFGGVTVLFFVIFHILQYTAEVVHVGYVGARAASGHIIDPASRMVIGFQPANWWVFVVYSIAMVFVCLHVYHGLWSALATLGANVSKKAQLVLQVCSAAIAAVIFLGFMAAPVAILMGVIK